jgi:hypothetical protein
MDGLSRLSRQCGIFDISQAYRLTLPAIGIASFCFSYPVRAAVSQSHDTGSSQCTELRAECANQRIAQDAAIFVRK